MGGINSGKPVPQHKLRRAEFLLAHGVSQRKVARDLGVCRKSIRKYLRAKAIAAKHGRTLTLAGPTRCPTCGALVNLPCLRCQLAGSGDRRRIA